MTSGQKTKTSFERKGTMKTKITLLALALAGALNLTTAAQDAPAPGDRPPHGGGPEGRPGRPPSPLVAVLDANKDGVIDASEIAGASAALATLDKNKDGKLSADELRPPHRGPRPDGAPADGQQPPKPPGAGPDGAGKRPVPPLVAALDANGDGVIDAAELANAPAALRTLDKNVDGQLTQDELRPAGGRGPGPGGRGPGGRHGGPGGPKGPQGGPAGE
jgi:hypothetical protein